MLQRKPGSQGCGKRRGHEVLAAVRSGHRSRQEWRTPSREGGLPRQNGAEGTPLASENLRHESPWGNAGKPPNSTLADFPDCAILEHVSKKKKRPKAISKQPLPGMKAAMANRGSRWL